MIKRIYDLAWSFSEDIAYLELNDQWRYVDKKGRKYFPK